jgi:phosphoribosylanthranilate isomerase
MRERFSVVQALGVGEDGLEALQRRMGAIARHVDAILLDTARPGQLGGTGETFDWSLLPQLQSPVPIMVAGGLNAGNLPTLLRQARPWGVDVASGVESAPGIKEATLLRRFFAALREEPTPTA